MRNREGVGKFLGNDVIQWLIVGLGPVGVDFSVGSPEMKGIVFFYLGVSLESQTTKPNQQLAMS